MHTPNSISSSDFQSSALLARHGVKFSDSQVSSCHVFIVVVQNHRPFNRATDHVSICCCRSPRRGSLSIWQRSRETDPTSSVLSELVVLGEIFGPVYINPSGTAVSLVMPKTADPMPDIMAFIAASWQTEGTPQHLQRSAPIAALDVQRCGGVMMGRLPDVDCCDVDAAERLCIGMWTVKEPAVSPLERGGLKRRPGCSVVRSLPGKWNSTRVMWSSPALRPRSSLRPLPKLSSQRLFRRNCEKSHRVLFAPSSKAARLPRSGAHTQAKK